MAEFKYLGLVINRANNSPTSMLEKRICKARAAFNNIECQTILLGFFNRRVRVQLVQAIAVTSLLYGSVIFGCLGPARLALKGGAPAFARAEIVLRKMLRWALRTTPIDIRVSMLFLASNSCNL